MLFEAPFVIIALVAVVMGFMELIPGGKAWGVMIFLPILLAGLVMIFLPILLAGLVMQWCFLERWMECHPESLTAQDEGDPAPTSNFYRAMPFELRMRY